MKTFMIFLKGMLMGAADVVPGVSGGTMAFITGIYDRLINGLCDLSTAFKLFFSGEFKKSWKIIDISLFLPLGLGIVTAFLIGAGIIPQLIDAYPVYIYSFFIGLILASAYIVYTHIKNHSIRHALVYTVLGALIGGFVALSPSVSTNPSLPFTFFLGMLAISAMLLPGISGSYILLMFGQYEYFLNALHTLDFSVIMVFGVGAIVGLLVFSRLLSYLLQKYHSQTFYVLGGIMLGALLRPGSHILEKVSSSTVFGSVLLLVIGSAVVLLLEKATHRKP